MEARINKSDITPYKLVLIVGMPDNNIILLTLCKAEIMLVFCYIN